MVPDTQADQSTTQHPWRAVLTRLLKVAAAVWRELADGQLSLHAMSLVYTTLLSLVPLLAVSFSVLKAFGVHNQIKPLLLTILAPLGAQGVEITDNVIGFVENMEVGVLGAVGLSLLFYTVVSLIQKIESAFNFAWRVAQSRPLAQRFSQYLGVLMVGPILVFSAMALTGTLLSSELAGSLLSVQPFGMLFGLLGKLLPYVLVIAAFTFIYVYIPNTKVRFGSALLGATVAGLIWQTGGWAFGSFIASSTHYTAIYASFAIVILFMIWLYLSWLILLLGASIAFYFQHPEYQSGSRAPRRLNACAEERAGLVVHGPDRSRTCTGRSRPGLRSVLRSGSASRLPISSSCSTHWSGAACSCIPGLSRRLICPRVRWRRSPSKRCWTVCAVPVRLLKSDGEMQR